jgi:molybdopterin converting factor small subunit
VKVQVKMFAVARQLAEKDVIELQLPDGATVGTLRAELLSAVPALAALSRHLLLAVNAEYAPDGMSLPPHAEVACIPPVSGG